MASDDDDAYPDDDDFDDYNPHPYAGGYDISATYGAPRPPSTATCYPVDSTPAPVTAPSYSLPQPSAPTPLPPPQPQQPTKPSSSPPQPPPAQPYYWPEPYSWGHAPPDHHPMYASPEVFRAWPFLSAAHCHSHPPCCGRDYWRRCMRGLDYLFGHSDGYGERRIGLDCSGVPVYANRKGRLQDAVLLVQVPPTETVDWHYAGEQPDDNHNNNTPLQSWYGTATATGTATAENAEPAYASYDRPCEYSEAYADNANSTYTLYDQSYSSQGVLDQPSWFLNQSYQEVYQDQDSFQYQDYSSYGADNISSQPTVCYNQHFGEQPLHVHVEPPESVSSLKLEYYENFSTYATENDFDNLESSGNAYEIQPYLHTPSDQLEPYSPSWSKNLEYYQACTEEVSTEYDNYIMASGESWDMSNLFASPFYPQETQIYEHSYGDENV